MSTGARDDGETAASATARAKFRVLVSTVSRKTPRRFAPRRGRRGNNCAERASFISSTPRTTSRARSRGGVGRPTRVLARFTSAETRARNANASTDEGWTRPAMSREYIGWDESLDVLRRAFQEKGPFDGVLGFSRDRRRRARLPHADDDELRASVKFVILVAGFEPRDARMVANMNATSPFSMPSLHVHGDKDALITRERGPSSPSAFDSIRREFFFHDGSHGVPTSLAKFIKGWLAREIERGAETPARTSLRDFGSLHFVFFTLTEARSSRLTSRARHGLDPWKDRVDRDGDEPPRDDLASPVDDPSSSSALAP